MAGSSEKTLEFIRAQLERRERFDGVAPATAAVVGLCGLGGALGAVLRGASFATGSDFHDPLLHWLAVLAVTAFLYVAASARGDREWRFTHLKPVARFAYSCQLAAMSVAALLTFALGQTDARGLIPALWLLCYGLGLWPASMVAGPAFRVASVGLVALGSAALVFPSSEHLWLGAGFGGMHVVMGIVLWFTQRQRYSTS